MDLPVLQIETNLDMQLEHVKITCIYIYIRVSLWFLVYVYLKNIR